MISGIEGCRLAIQSNLDSQKTIDDRRMLGQFATPTELAREIANYASTLISRNIDFLEPAVGTGSFYSALISQDVEIKTATGFEIDPFYFEPSKELWKSYPISIENKDFLLENPENKINLLICNPPYVRHHSIASEKKSILQKKVKDELGIDISGLSGLYCYFILLSHKWLSPGAISAWLVPSEFMDVGYGTALKEYLLNNVTLMRIHRYDPDDTQFDDATVSSSVVWFINKKPTGEEKVLFTYGGTHQNPGVSKEVSYKILKHEAKWTRFPLKEERNEDSKMPLSHYFKVKRGIATGDNDFFIMDLDKAINMGISEKYLQPILPSPRNMKAVVIEADKSGYPLLDKKIVLLNCTDSLEEIKAESPATYDYLKNGEADVSKRYLCSKRKQWYFQEQRVPAKILCSYMGRGENNPFRFIWNESRAVVTNTYLMLYPTKEFIDEFGEENLHKAWKYLVKIGNKLSDESRVYGGGLKKIEPKELMSVDVSGMKEFLKSE